MIVQLEGIIQDKDVKEKIREIDKDIERLTKVPDFARYEMDNWRNFEKSCLVIGQELHKDGKLMTVTEYETAIEMLQERAEEMKKIRNKHK